MTSSDDLRRLACAAYDLADLFTVPDGARERVGVPLILEPSGPRAIAVVPDDARDTNPVTEHSAGNASLGIRCVRIARSEAEWLGFDTSVAFWASVGDDRAALAVILYSGSPYSPPLRTYRPGDLT